MRREEEDEGGRARGSGGMKREKDERGKGEEGEMNEWEVVGEWGGEDEGG